MVQAGTVKIYEPDPFRSWNGNIIVFRYVISNHKAYTTLETEFRVVWAYTYVAWNEANYLGENLDFASFFQEDTLEQGSYNSG